MIVLSVFDGMSCGHIALDRLQMEVTEYFSSEIDPYAIKTSSIKYPKTFNLCSFTGVRGCDLPKIDLIIGGSPCQGFSIAGKKLNFNDPRSALFFEYVRLLEECRAINPDIKFLLENVRMKQEHEDVISRILGIQPININSTLVSAQNRERLYWTNIAMTKVGLFGDNFCTIPQPKDKGIYLRDILQLEVAEKYYLSANAIASMKKRKQKNEAEGKGFGAQIKTGDDKSPTILARYYKDGSECLIRELGNIKFGRTDEGKEIRKKSRKLGKDFNPFQAKQIIGLDFDKMSAITTSLSEYNLLSDEKYERIRRLTPIEVCRLQTVDDDYFFHDGKQIVSDTQIYRMCGNGWNVDTICHIFSHLK